MALREGEWDGCDKGRDASGGGVITFGLGRYAKRTFDIVVATVGIVLFSPILLLTSVAIKLNSPGPILDRQTLFGYGRRAVRVHRFRLATHCLETQSITPHLTRVGRIMHQTGIGGLPQLFSVLFGEMSIVGPRAYVNEQDFCGFPAATLLSSVKPGILDWANPAEFWTAEQRVNEDLYHAKRWSLYNDIKIVLTVLFAEKPVDQSTSLVRRKVVRVQK